MFTLKPKNNFFAVARRIADGLDSRELNLKKPGKLVWAQDKYFESKLSKFFSSDFAFGFLIVALIFLTITALIYLCYILISIIFSLIPHAQTGFMLTGAIIIVMAIILTLHYANQNK
jgi:ABC-type Na+ efflux pump permease subunit